MTFKGRLGIALVAGPRLWRQMPGERLAWVRKGLGRLGL